MTQMLLGSTKRERIGSGVLVAATLVVGVSIVLDDAPARILNGVGGLTWFASAAILAAEGKRREAPLTQWAAIGALTAAVAFVIRPSDLVLASIGFGAAGLGAGLIAKRDVMLWAKMVPALYLPMHIGTAVLKAAGRSMLGMESSIRTEPPPTAAIVPAVMVAAAVVGGCVATWIRTKRHDSTPVARASDS
jgi:hypothetical protein